MQNNNNNNALPYTAPQGSFDYNIRQGSDMSLGGGSGGQDGYNTVSPMNNNSFTGMQQNGSGSQPLTPSSAGSKFRKVHNPYSSDKTTRVVGTPQSNRDASSPSSPILMGSQNFITGGMVLMPGTPQHGSQQNLANNNNGNGGKTTPSPTHYTNNPYKPSSPASQQQPQYQPQQYINNNNYQQFQQQGQISPGASGGYAVPLMENLTLPANNSNIIIVNSAPVPAPLYSNNNTNMNNIFGISNTTKKPSTPPTEFTSGGNVINTNTNNSSSSVSNSSSLSDTVPPQQQQSTNHAAASSTGGPSFGFSSQRPRPAVDTANATAVAAANPSASQQQLPTAGMTIDETYDYLLKQKDDLADLARTAQGSSTLQAAIKTGDKCTTLIWETFEDCLGDLMLDANAGYVVRVLLDTVPREAAVGVCERITEDSLLAFSLCTHSLHTRRLVQSIMETVDRNFLSTVLINSCAEVAKTQQGCIVMQRALDHCIDKNRTRLVAAIAQNVAQFATDPFANYVIQYLLDTAPREETVPLIWNAIKGHVLRLSCNKFASNVIEKFLILADQTSQHALIEELYNNDTNGLCRIMQDSFGNYIVQATIARSSFADLQFINERLRPVLDMVPYGSKIAARLDRRLSNPNHNSSHYHHHNNNNMMNIPAPASRMQQQQQQQQGSGGGGGARHYHQKNHNNNYHRGHHNNNNSHYNNSNNTNFNSNTGGYQQQQQPQYVQAPPPASVSTTTATTTNASTFSVSQQQVAYSGVSSTTPTPAW